MIISSGAATQRRSISGRIQRTRPTQHSSTPTVRGWPRRALPYRSAGGGQHRRRRAGDAGRGRITRRRTGRNRWAQVGTGGHRQGRAGEWHDRSCTIFIYYSQNGTASGSSGSTIVTGLCATNVDSGTFSEGVCKDQSKCGCSRQYWNFKPAGRSAENVQLKTDEPVTMMRWRESPCPCATADLCKPITRTGPEKAWIYHIGYDGYDRDWLHYD